MDIFKYLKVSSDHVAACVAVYCCVLLCAAMCCSVMETLQDLERHGVATISRLLKIIGLFCKKPYTRDYFLQKRIIIFRSLLIVATPQQDPERQGAVSRVATISRAGSLKT